MTAPAAMPPSAPAALRRRRAWDIALSVVLLVLTYGAFLIGCVFALLGLAFTDNCSPETCDTSAGVDAVFTVGIVIALVGFLATVGVIVLQVLRMLSWWIAAAALAFTIVGWIVGFGLYASAIT